MEQYKIIQDGFKEIRKQMLIRTIPILLLAVTVGIIISSVNSKEKASEVNVLPIVIPLIGVSIGVGLYRGVNRQKNIFESYTLTLTNNLITREQLNTQTVSIYFNDIKEIVKNKNGSFTVRGKGTTDLIGIPAQIENYSQLENSLNQISPVVSKITETSLQKYRSILIFLTLGLMVCVYIITNKIIVVLSGVLLIFILLWSFYEVQRSKNIDSKTKKGMWWMLLVLASIIGTIIIKLIELKKNKSKKPAYVRYAANKRFGKSVADGSMSGSKSLLNFSYWLDNF